jgi:hypothetical protein
MGLLLCAAAVKAAEERAKAVATATEKLQQSEAAFELDRKKRVGATVPKDVAHRAALAARRADPGQRAHAAGVRGRGADGVPRHDVPAGARVRGGGVRRGIAASPALRDSLMTTSAMKLQLTPLKPEVESLFLLFIAISKRILDFSKLLQLQ